MWHARMQKKSIWTFVKSSVYENVTVSFQQCIDKGFLYNIHFLSFYPFFCVTRKLSTTVFLPHGMGFVDIFAVCLRSRDTLRDILIWLVKFVQFLSCWCWHLLLWINLVLQHWSRPALVLNWKLIYWKVNDEHYV